MSDIKNPENPEQELQFTDLAPEDGRQSEAARAIQRGVTRMLSQQNTSCMPEISLPNYRRADLMGVTHKGELWIVEIKSGLADFQADKKWPEYLPYCDRFFFAVAPDFPVEKLPEDVGYIFADAYGAEIIRPAVLQKLAAARRSTLMRRLARIGGFRWAPSQQ